MCVHYRRDDPDHFRELPRDVYPGRLARVIRRGSDGGVEEVVMSWGFPPPPGTGGRGPVVNVRNLASGYWRRFLFPEFRCLIPFDEFSEWTETRPKREVWFRPTFEGAAFAGIWAPGAEGAPPVHAVLTRAPNRVVAAVHPKAMPVVVRPEEREVWLRLPARELVGFQERPAEDALERIAD